MRKGYILKRKNMISEKFEFLVRVLTCLIQNNINRITQKYNKFSYYNLLLCDCCTRDMAALKSKSKDDFESFPNN